MSLSREKGERATVLPLLECNARCPFCSTRVYTEHGLVSVQDWRKGTRDAPIRSYASTREEMREAYEGLVAAGVRSVNLQGGEPTLWPGLEELVRFGWELGLDEQVVVSNGRRFADAAYAASLLDAAPTSIGLSIFGATPATHDESMGVRGAFDDVLAGVRHLVRLAAAQRGPRRTSLVAQFTLHERNWRELPRMARLWYGEGLRIFSVRLLRETVNTTRRPEQTWFFDLASLSAPLAETLDFLREQPGAVAQLAEIPYCLLPPAHLADVLRDARTNGGPGRKTYVMRDGARGSGDGDSYAGTDACERCDLAGACSKLEQSYAPLFRGELRPIRVKERLAGWAEHGLHDDDALRLAALVDDPSHLSSTGADPADVAALARAVQRARLARTPEAARARLLPPANAERLAATLAARGAAPVTLHPLALPPGSGASLEGDRGAILAALARGAAPADAPLVAELARGATCVFQSRWLTLLAVERGAEGGRATLVLVPVFDASALDEATARALFAPSLEAAGAAC